jgi:hypothetical protein
VISIVAGCLANHDRAHSQGENFNPNRKENTGLDQTKENKIEIKENSDKRITAFRPLFYCSKSIRIECL